jgi:colanic acid biosynthesis protein WcaH
MGTPITSKCTEETAFTICVIASAALSQKEKSTMIMQQLNVTTSDDEFAHIVRLAPLVSIDLIIRDNEQKVLVALRTNEPAKGAYFVPGGCIRKNETIESAFLRILEKETGCRAHFADARFLGVFQHFYPTNRYELSGYGTHYVVLAYEMRFAGRPMITLDGQHSGYRWMNEVELKTALDVHDNTKAYFC